MTFRITLETDVVSRGLRRGNPHVKMSFHFRGLSPSPRTGIQGETACFIRGYAFSKLLFT